MALAQNDREEPEDEGDDETVSESSSTKSDDKESKTSIHSSTSASKPKPNTMPDKKDKKKGDARQQFHTGPVNSSDYKEERKHITLYLRDGDNAKAYLKNKTLYRKGASYLCRSGQ